MTESQGPAGAESPTAIADNSTGNSVNRLVAIAIAWIIGLTCLFGLLCGISAFEQLLLGWIYFPLTVLPRVTGDWPSVLVGVLALGLFLVVLHRTLRWLLRQGGMFSPSENPRRLWRATFAVAGIFLLMLAAGTAIVGAVHQATWIATGRTSPAAGQPVPEPVFGAIANSKVSMRRSTVKWKLQEMGIAVEGYEESYRQLPPGGTMDDQGRLYHGWATYLSGFLGFSRQGIHFSIPWNEAPNDRLYQCQLEVFVNPQVEEIFDREGFGLSHFAGNLQVLRLARLPIPRDAPFSDFIETARSSPDAHRRNLPLRISEITDGAANTLLIGESRGRFRPWGDPANLRDPALGNGRSLEGFGSPSDRSAALYLMCDGSVRPIGYEIDPKVFAALGTPARGESESPGNESHISTIETDESSTAVKGSDFDGAETGDSREVGGIKLRWCPPGRFLMGSPQNEPERRPGEDQVEVTLTNGFWMAQYETTQGEWKRVVGELPGELTDQLPAGEDYPVGNVNFSEAEAFCQKLTETSRKSGELPTGWEFRLPTEAQWEYACRAGTTTATSFGDKISSHQANFQGKPYNGGEVGPALKMAAKVGGYPANPWGLHDLHGNTCEWCRDWYHAKLPGGTDPDLHLAKSTALKNQTGDYSRVRRGGTWTDDGWPNRSAFRQRFEPDRRYDHIGFRVVVVRLKRDR